MCYHFGRGVRLGVDNGVHTSKVCCGGSSVTWYRLVRRIIVCTVLRYPMAIVAQRVSTRYADIIYLG